MSTNAQYLAHKGLNNQLANQSVFGETFWLCHFHVGCITWQVTHSMQECVKHAYED